MWIAGRGQGKNRCTNAYWIAFLAVVLMQAVAIVWSGQSSVSSHVDESTWVSLKDLQRQIDQQKKQIQNLQSQILQNQSSRNSLDSSTATSSAVISSAFQSVGAEGVWKSLLDEGSALVRSQKLPGAVFEVGMHKATQCVEAAEKGLSAHCFEPSPKSYERVLQGVKAASVAVQGLIRTYNMAASNTNEGTVPFKSSGGTGDHVGNHNMWSMEKEEENTEKGSEMIQVKQVRLDDVVQKVGDVFLIKVDTQGFEPSVFSGLTESIRNRKIHFVLVEYWPKGMDFLADRLGDCIAVEKVLHPLVAAGYKLYAMAVQAHPRAPSGWKNEIPSRPLGSLQGNCQWYYNVEKLHPSQEYKMGYWSDILAVSPNAPLDSPVTDVGRALLQDRRRSSA